MLLRDTPVIDFLDWAEKKRHFDIEIENTKEKGRKNTISLVVCVFVERGVGVMKTIELDEEDIAYFVNKYQPKVKEEFNNHIDAIKELYKKTEI
jgi:hypothetical protein